MEELQIKTLPVGLLPTCCYILSMPGRNDCLVVDPGDEPERIRQACGGRRIAAILLTHGHFDHIGGVAGLMEKDTELVIHPLDVPMLSDPALNSCAMIGRIITAPAPTRTVEEGDVLDYAGITLRVLHTPGHTPGGVCYERENLLLSGDTMFRFGWGRTDLPGGNEEDLQRSLERLRPLRRDHVLYPGHTA